MMRGKASSSMQKTYDECFLICSTAVYFEGQNNEPEALRSWRSALDRIYYHNAYRVPPDYRPKSETERALQESLRNMELQCKERVTLLEALRDSRDEAAKSDAEGKDNTSGKKPAVPGTPTTEQAGWIGGGTVPAVSYPDLSKIGPPLPQRPGLQNAKNSQSWSRPSLPKSSESRSFRVESSHRVESSPFHNPSELKPLTPNPPPILKQTSRTPSPDKRNRLRTTLRPTKDARKPTASKPASKKPPAASKAAGLAWDAIPSAIPSASGQKLAPNSNLGGGRGDSRRVSEDSIRRDAYGQPPSPPPHLSSSNGAIRPLRHTEPLGALNRKDRPSNIRGPKSYSEDLISQTPVKTSSYATAPVTDSSPNSMKSPITLSKPDVLSYRSEYPTPTPMSQASITAAVNRPKTHDTSPTTALPSRHRSPARKAREAPPKPPVHRRPVANSSTPRASNVQPGTSKEIRTSSDSAEETTSSRDPDREKPRKLAPRKKTPRASTEEAATPDSSELEPEGDPESDKWEERLAYVKKNLPKGVDPSAAQQIFNEIVVQGDEVHWSDVAGLEPAKKALKEAVVYPFLRPDLFMGLREPARGMLLFGPPGTGKTMLARAVATESRSTFFAISASSLTSKWLGDSEKLVRALFLLAKALAPSIIFVDEIDSLLSSRGGSSEHESTRRIKTEFLIQWSDLQRAAAGKEQTEKDKREGDAMRVLVLAATNLPWAIDEAARRRFVRRQYIPLPEDWVRAEQLKTLMGHQKHSLDSEDIEVLVQLTEGYSGSDITALAKDAAMGPLRSLGEALLSMSMDEIRPIQFEDFEASLVNIRPSVSKQGLKEFEDWAREFGERGG